MTEVPEFCGAEHVLAHRAKDAATARAVYKMVDWYKDYAATAGAVLNENPSPGNVAGGLLNIAIKSLGAIAKGGTTRVEGVTDYAEPPKGRGLQLMQGPGYDQESTPGLVAAGATVVVFTTGNGTTIGNAIAPVIKLASNDKTFRRMSSDIDLSAGGVVKAPRPSKNAATASSTMCAEWLAGRFPPWQRSISTANFKYGARRQSRYRRKNATPRNRPETGALQRHPQSPGFGVKHLRQFPDNKIQLFDRDGSFIRAHHDVELHGAEASLLRLAQALPSPARRLSHCVPDRP